MCHLLRPLCVCLLLVCNFSVAARAQFACSFSYDDAKFDVKAERRIGVWRRPPYTVTFDSAASAYGLGTYASEFVRLSEGTCDCNSNSKFEWIPASDSGTTFASVEILPPEGTAFSLFREREVRGLYTASLGTGTTPSVACLLPAPHPSDIFVHEVNKELRSKMLARNELAFWSCIERCQATWLGLTAGFAFLPRTYTVERNGSDGALEATHCLELDATLEFSSEASCDTGVDRPSFRWVLYSDSRKTIAGGATQSDGTASAGLLVFDETGVIVAVGVFAEPEFDVFTDDDGRVRIQGTYSWGTSILTDEDFGNSTEVVVLHDALIECFQAGTSAEVNRDSILCWDDRKSVVEAIGSEFGDVLYNPRADIDTDGDVDIDDYLAYVLLFDAQASCKGDYNCSGTITLQDLFDFLDDYYGSSLKADYNGSGSVTTQDLFDFLDGYYGSCS